VLVAAFISYQLVYTSKTLYMNSMLVVYFLFYLLCILSLTWTIDTDYSSYTVIRMGMIFVNLVALYNILKVFKVHEAIFSGFLIGMLVNFALATELISIAYPIYTKGRFIGSTVHPNVIGIFALFAILGSILLLQNAKNKLWIVINLVNILGALYVITLAASRSALLISIFIILLYVVQVFINPKTRIYLFVAIGALFIMFVYFVDLAKLAEHVNFMMDRIAGIFGALGGRADSSTAERLLFVQIMMDVFKENPFWGTGVNTSRVFLHGFYTHNNYVEILGTLGIFGLLLYYSAYAHMIWKISLVKDFWIKYYLVAFSLVIIIFDFAAVTFYAKSTLMMLLVLHFMAEENRNVS